jgi:hypothetical protein
MSLPNYVRGLAVLQPLLEKANHVDVKTVESTVSMTEFIAGTLNYQPAWLSFLFAVRSVFVRALGIRHNGQPVPQSMQPEQVPLQAGQSASFFKVRLAQADSYWAAEAIDTHLSAILAVVVEPLDLQHKRFHVLTIVHYHKWTGPLYFNIIRPFHHVVVQQMAKAGANNHTSTNMDGVLSR